MVRTAEVREGSTGMGPGLPRSQPEDGLRGDAGWDVLRGARIDPIGRIESSMRVRDGPSVDGPEPPSIRNPDCTHGFRTCLARCLRPPRGVLGHSVPSAARRLLGRYRSQRCDFVDLAQNGFCTRPVAHHRHDFATLSPRYRARLGTVHVRRLLCLGFASTRKTGSPPNTQRAASASGTTWSVNSGL